MSLSDLERGLVRDVGFDEDLCATVREGTGRPLERLLTVDWQSRELRPGPGLSIRVKDGEDAERLMNLLRPHVWPRGYRLFWSNRASLDGLSPGDELAMLKTLDPFAIVRLCNSNGANYDVDTDDIIDHLTSWQARCEFEVVGASGDWVALHFSRLPADVCAFAAEIYLFCPDTVDQGVGLQRESKAPELFRAARELCPGDFPAVKRREDELTATILARMPPDRAEDFQRRIAAAAKHSTSTEMGVRLLAHELREKNYVFLWWD